MYRELHGLHETSHRTLLSRMDMERWNQQPNHLHRPPSLPQATWNPNLEQRLSSQNCLLEVPLSRSQPSIKTSSSTAMLSSKNTERGRSRNRPCIRKSEPNLPVPSKMTRRESTQHSDPSLQRSKVTIQRRPWQQDEEREREGDTVPGLLSRMTRNPRQTRSQLLRNRRSTSQCSLGLDQKRKLTPNYPKTWTKRSNSLEFIPWTLRQRCDRSPIRPVVQNSQTRNGEISSEGKPLIWTPYSADNFPLRTMNSKWKNSGTSNSLLERLSPLKSSRTVENGRLPGTELSKRPLSLSRIDCKNLPDMGSTSSPCSPLLIPASIPELFPSTRRFENESDQSEMSSYPTILNSPTSKSLTSIQSECPPVQKDQPKGTKRGDRSEERVGSGPSLVTSGMMGPVGKRKRIAGGTMCATVARNEDTKGKNVAIHPIETGACKRPRYLRSLIWSSPSRQPLVSPTAYCTIYDQPLPRPPEDEYENLDAMTTISRNPDLFKIVTPINVNRFEQLLHTHPNQPFTDSVCVALREGFWPWAHTRLDAYPVTWDFSDRPPKTEREADFLRSQRDTELGEQRYSEGFGLDLYPGMYSTPIHSAPKPRSDKLRLINDHSAGVYSLNSMIARDDVMGARMDTISDLGAALLRFRQTHPETKLVMFKSDVSAAYRRLPLHPLWQIKQIATIDGVRHVDRCTSFGGRGSCRSYTAFMGLVLWIAIYVRFLADIFAYIDDNFSFDVDGNVLWYEPYGCYYPEKQTKLLLLWDEISLPHEKPKQEYGPALRIIGFWVDPNLMRVTMDDEDRNNLLERVQGFISTAPGGTRRTLREFQELAGWINWSFNVFPLLKPSLSNVYEKMSGKTETHAKIFVNKGVIRDLSWFVSEVRILDGVYLFEDVDWLAEDAELTAIGDACLSGMGFYFENSREGFQCVLPYHAPKHTIFYFEALVVVSIVNAVTHMPKVPSKLLVLSDNTNTVDIFQSLRCKPPYNDLVKFTVSLLLKHHISLRVVHIPGIDNIVADALSRFQNERALAACPGLKISTFQPPQLTMGQEEI